MKTWQDIINKGAENFAGDTLLNRQEELKVLYLLMEQWSQISLQLFTRHQKVRGSATGSGLMTEQRIASADTSTIIQQSRRMTQINSAVNYKLALCGDRAAGENGEW